MSADEPTPDVSAEAGSAADTTSDARWGDRPPGSHGPAPVSEETASTAAEEMTGQVIALDWFHPAAEA